MEYAAVSCHRGLLFFCIRRYRQYFLCKSIYRFYGETLLFLPALLGLMFTAMLRSILFYYDTEVYNLIEHYAELNLMIPLLSLLCTASILLSVKMLGEMEKEHEKDARRSCIKAVWKSWRRMCWIWKASIYRSAE